MAYKIEHEFCAGCAQCKVVCFFDAINWNGDEHNTYYTIDPEKCMSCGQCAPVCPAKLITLDENSEKRPIKSIAVIPEKCIGCSLCKKACPVGAVDGVIKQPFVIDQDKCIKCGACAAKCRKDAFDIEYA